MAPKKPAFKTLAAFGFTAAKTQSPAKAPAAREEGEAADAAPPPKKARADPLPPPPASAALPAPARGVPATRDPALAARWAKKVAADDAARAALASNAAALVPARGAPAGAPPKAGAPTPLDRQIAALQAANPGTLLAVEVGYKWVFFGDADAGAAQSVLHIFAYSERGGLRASVPAPSLAKSIRRLVAAGHRVGVVRQKETAALKKSGVTGAPKSGPFAREVTAVYSASTLDAGDEADVGPPPAGRGAGGGGGGAAAAAAPPSASTFLLAIADAPAAGGGDSVSLGLVALDPASGEARCGGGLDGPSRAALERALLTLAPPEVLAVGAVTKATRRVLDAYAARAGARGGVRIEDGPALDPGAARARVRSFFEGTPGAEGGAMPGACDGDQAAVALAASLARLDALRLAAPLRAAGPAGVRALDPDATLALPPSALASLEVLAPTNGAPGAQGSLLWLVDRARTRAGSRTLRDWLARPLADPAAIEARLGAVDELRAAVETGVGPLAALPAALAASPDLQRGLARALHRTASPAEFVALCRSLAGAADAVGVKPVEHGAAGAAAVPGVASPLLASLLAALLDARVIAVAAAALAPLDAREATAAGDRARLLADAAAFPRSAAAKARVADREAALTALLPALKKAAPGVKPAYAHVTNVGDYLVELPAGAKAPGDWVRVSSTKKLDRYWPPAVKAGLDALQVAREEAAAAVVSEWRAHLASLAPHYPLLRNAAAAAASLDALLSFADAAASEGWTRPAFTPADGRPASLALRAVVHPMLAAAARATGGAAVPNDVSLGGDSPSTLVVTGPNMGGKSCATRAVALAVLLAHAGCPVPAAAGSALAPVDAVFTRMGASDSLLLSRSTFFEEMAETADILRLATPASLIIFDELGRGTSTSDGAAIAGAVLAAVAASRARCLFITHFVRALDFDAAPAGTVAVAHMEATVDGGGDSGAEERVTFTYRLAPGACPKSYGTNVARLAGLPPAVVARADQLAGELERGGGLAVAGGLSPAVAAAVRRVAAAAAAGDAGALDGARSDAAMVAGA